MFNQDLRFGSAKPKNKSLKSVFRVKPKYKDRSKTCFHSIGQQETFLYLKCAKLNAVVV